MKKIFILFAILQFSLLFNVKAQGNLQFNQVISQIGQLSFCSGSPTWTVPAGKVWKVEYFSRTWNMFYVNGFSINGSGSMNEGVLWLKAGDYVTFVSTCNIYAGFNQPATYVFSAIEYNIVP
jgi:hypothetical protein